MVFFGDGANMLDRRTGDKDEDDQEKCEAKAMPALRHSISPCVDIKRIAQMRQ